MNGYDVKINEVLESFSVNQTKGLTDEQVNKNIAQFGKNQLVEKRGETLIHMIVGELMQFLNILLIIAAVISMIARLP